MLFCFISCGNSIELYNLNCTVDKEEYKVDEEIQIFLTGNFKPRDKIRNYSFWVTLFRLEENTTEYSSKKVNVISVNDEAFTPGSTWYQRCYEAYEATSFFLFQFGRQINENVLKIDDKMVITVSEPGSYQLDVNCYLYPKMGYYIGDSQVFHVDFTVTE